ncbi:MAG: GAF domain-containing protein [Alphaproteobacteria bacterium]|nr:GAF domain-containing protein [Alphaproteobacteria bacterium]
MADLQRANVALRRQLADQRAERDVALAEKAALASQLADQNDTYSERQVHQAATNEVLAAMAASPADPQPVFDLIAARARDICGSYGVSVMEFDGVMVHLRAWTGVSDDPGVRQAYIAQFPRLPDRTRAEGRAILDRQVVHVRDYQTERELQLSPGNTTVKSNVAVPMKRGTEVIGVVTMGSRAVGGFSDSQIELLKTFADQAVIAISSAAAHREQREALDHQSAMAEVLAVINTSLGDPTPVFETILAKAHTLFGAETGSLGVFDGKMFKKLARRGYPPDVDDFLSRPYPPVVQHQPLLRGETIHVPDVTTHAWPAGVDAPAFRRWAGEGLRAWLEVPLWKDDALLGSLSVWRAEPRAFTPREIQLLESFAAQAVIALENTRLLGELRETLARQTATAEVLRIINASPGNLEPVFDAILAKAHDLCGAPLGSLQLFDGERFRAVATRGMDAAFSAFLRRGYRPTGAAAVPHEHSTQIVDAVELARQNPNDPVWRATTELGQIRTLLAVPLAKDGNFLGRIVAARREVRPFTDKQIALLENFAAQAVIAMENARLINETREALEQQTATAGVLRVIANSPTDTQPVFNTISERAPKLCNADMGMVAMVDGDLIRLASIYGVAIEGVEAARQAMPMRLDHETATARAVRTGSICHIPDIAEDPLYLNKHAAQAMRYRACLAVPMFHSGEVVGAIFVARSAPGLFPDSQIKLLETFADQAVIAIENVRLFTELKDALDQQIATSEVLQVINANPGNLMPVFDAMLEKAMRLCGAAFGELHTWDGAKWRAVAVSGLPDAYAEYYRTGQQGAAQETRRLANDSLGARAAGGERVVHIADLKDTESYRIDAGVTRAMVDLGGARTAVGVTLRKDGELLGGIVIYRQEVRPFSEKEIELLENFAAQAVIAMENARLLNEIRERQGELDVTFQSMGDGVALFDETHRLAAWNQHFQDMLDVPAEVVSARPSFSDYVQYLADRGEYGAEPADTVERLRANAGQSASLERTRPSGQTIQIRINPTPAGGFVVIYTDITERKRAEEALRAARDAAEDALRELKIAQSRLIQAEKMASLGQLTAGIAHEIKNPLNFVNNFASLSVELLDELRETAAPGFAHLDAVARADIDNLATTLTTNLQRIEEHGRRADGIVKSMLEHSRETTGEQHAVELNALVEEALNLAYHGARAQDQGFNITLEQDFTPDIAPITLAPQEMTRVLLNLISNGFYAARKRAQAEPGHDPVLRVSTRDLGDAVEIMVRDNGVGVPEKIKDKLFQPFFTTKPTGEGTGLGLSITWDIVTKQHGGTIEVASEPGSFTEFTVRLPRSR